MENNERPLSTQGSDSDKEEQLGGTTNLSLEQLKEEGDNNSPTEVQDAGDYTETDTAEDTDLSDTFDEVRGENYATDQFDDLADEEDQDRNDGYNEDADL